MGASSGKQGGGSGSEGGDQQHGEGGAGGDEGGVSLENIPGSSLGVVGGRAGSFRGELGEEFKAREGNSGAVFGLKSGSRQVKRKCEWGETSGE